MEDKWEEHLSLIPEKGNAYIVLVEKREGKNRLEDLGIYGRIKLNGVLKK
jgi:hypothetical protein